MADPMQRERITDIGKGDTYKSFIREYLCELTSCLSSDGAVGGSHNQIRDRVREIMASSNEYGPGRSALDARFALGADDDRYLATAVLPLWASFDSDEQLDLATDVPIEVREASAVGMVGHFRKMLDARESNARSGVAVCTDFVAWLLSVPEIRKAALFIAKERGATDDTLDTISARYGDASDDRLTRDTNAGVQFVRELSIGNEEQLRDLRALFEALFVLLDDENMPMQRSRDFDESAFKNAVQDAREDTERLMQTFLLFGAMDSPDEWCRANRFDASDPKADREATRRRAEAAQDALDAALAAQQADQVAELQRLQQEADDDLQAADARGRRAVEEQRQRTELLRQQAAQELDAERQRAQGVLDDQIDRTVRVQQQRDRLEAERNRLQALLAGKEVAIQQLNQQLEDVQLDNQAKGQQVVRLEGARAEVEQRLVDLANETDAEIRRIADEGAQALARVQAAAEAEKQAAIEAKDAQIAQAQDDFDRGVEDLQRRATDQLEQERLASVLRARLVERRERAEQDRLQRELTAEQRVSTQVENLRVTAEQYREEAERNRAAMQVDLEAISVSRATAERARLAAQDQVDALQRRVVELEQQQREQAQAAARQAGANADEPRQEGETWSSWIGRVVNAAARAANPGMADIFDSDTDAAAGASAGVSSTMQALFKAQPPMPRGDATGAPPPSALFPYPDSDSDSDDGAGALGGRANARDAEIARLRVEAQGYRDALAEMEQAEEERVAQALTAARMRQVMQDTFAIECPTVDDADRVSLENLGNALYRSFQRVSLDDTRDIEALGPGWKTKSTVTPFLRPRTQVAWNSMLDTSVPVAAPPPAPPAAAAAAAAPVAPAAPARNFGYRLDGTQMTSLEDLTVQLDGGFARSEARYRTAYRVKPAYVNDASYIEYAMLRGLCALRGPHQELLADDTMLYTFPAVALRRQDAVLALSSDVLVNANDLASLQSTAIRAYTDIPASTVAGKTIDPAAPLMRAESDRRGGAVPLQDATGSPTGQEPAMEALWTPLTSENPATEQREVMFNSPSIAVCKAACLETLIVYLKSLRAKAATRSDPDQRTYAIEPALDAIIAATKLRQLKSIAEVARAGGNRAVTVRRDDAEQPMWFPRQSNSDERFITRPVLHCLVPEAVTDDEVVATSELVFPVAAGLGRLKRRDARAGDPRIPAAARFDWRAAPVEGCPGQPYTAGDMSKNLRDGMDSIRQAPRRRASDFEFYFAETTHGQPWQPGEDRRPRAFGEAVNTDPECVTLDRMSAVFANGLEGLQKLTQLERERDLLRRLEERGSVERRELFGIYENGEGGAPTPDSQRVTMEMASRNRRSAIWEQALRKLNVSGDRLLDFIKLLSGAVNESMEWVLEQSDPELQESQKRIQQRRKEIAQRTMQFQTRITEAVLNSALKDAKLTMGLKSAGDGLVILDSEERENFKQLASGATGRAFFDASVALQQAVDGGGKPQSIGMVLGQLQEVGTAFHQYLNKAFISGDTIARLSPETLADSANCFCIRMKPEAYAAIKMAHQDLYRELKHHYHPLNRMPSVWELVEGSNGQMCTAFANLCALKLKHTQFTSGSLAAYAGRDVRYSNAMEYQRIRGRLINIICEYVVHHTRPDFLVDGGREFYFGARRALPRGDGCAKRPPRPGEKPDVSDDSDDPMSDGETLDDRRAYRQAEDAAIDGLEQGRLQALQMDNALLDRVIAYETRQDRARQAIFDRLQGAAMLPGGRGALRALPPTVAAASDSVKAAAVATIMGDMQRFAKANKRGSNSLISKFFKAASSVFFTPPASVTQKQPCELQFTSSPVSAGVCLQLERTFRREYDSAKNKTVINLPQPKQLRKDYPQTYHGVQINLPELRAYLRSKNHAIVDLDQEISDALNDVFDLSTLKESVVGEDWVRLEAAPANPAAAAAEVNVYYIRMHRPTALAVDKESDGLVWSFISAIRDYFSRAKGKQIFFLGLVIVIAIGLLVPGSPIYSILAGAAVKATNVFVSISGLVAKIIQRVTGSDPATASWFADMMGSIPQILRDVWASKPTLADLSFLQRVVGFVYSASSAKEWWFNDVDTLEGWDAFRNATNVAATAAGAVASSTIIVVQHTTSSAGPSNATRKKQKTAVGVNAGGARVGGRVPFVDPRSAWERATHANATESMQREERWATEAIRAEAQAKRPGAWPMGRPGFEGRGGWLWSVDGAS